MTYKIKFMDCFGSGTGFEKCKLKFNNKML